jgi:RNA polymerase sigma-70 factor (ECF subfamily)
MMGGMDFAVALRELAGARTRDREVSLSLMGEEEFRSFYERTARPLWSYLARITGDRQQADDLMQEAYYRLYRAGATYESESHRRNSLFQIATNLVRDAARRAKRSEEVPLEDEQGNGPIVLSEAPLPEHQATIRTDLARAMQQLDPTQRELLWLAYAQGASHNEIAQILGVRAISVRTLLLRARRRMAALLTGHGQVEAPEAGR